MHAAAKWITLNSAAGGVLRGNLSLLARAAQIQGFMAEAAPESCRSLHTLRALIRSCWALSCRVLWHTIASKFRIQVVNGKALSAHYVDRDYLAVQAQVF
jgi:hypothetical protein